MCLHTTRIAHRGIPTKHATREEWLKEAIAELDAWFTKAGYQIPASLRVSCGLPSSGAFGKKQTIGQCWSPKASADEVIEIFVSPVLDNPTRVLDVLCHELIHAIVGTEHGHKAPFTQAARACGLTEGKPTTAGAGPELAEELANLARSLGRYPHGALNKALRKKQSTRMLKVTCPTCGYTLRTTAKWIEVGLPTCCCGSDMEMSP